MVTIEEIKDSGILTNLAEHTKFPFVEVNDYNGESGIIIYDASTSETDEEGYTYCDLTYGSFDDRFSDDYLKSLGVGEDWKAYAVFPPTTDEMEYVVFRPVSDDVYPDMDNIRMVDGALYLDDDA